MHMLSFIVFACNKFLPLGIFMRIFLIERSIEYLNVDRFTLPANYLAIFRAVQILF